MPATAAISQLGEPNLELPLAISNNVRGGPGTGFTNQITNSYDQRKINAIYEPIQNSFTQKPTLYVTKRPGVTINASSYGTTGQVGYLVGVIASATPWVFSTSGDDVRASSSAATTVIVTAAGYTPAYVDNTHVSGTEHVVLQISNSSNTYKVYFSSAIATWTEITDSQFPANSGNGLVGKMEFLDGWAFAMENGTNRIFNSDLNSLANWQAQNYITKQIKQDLGRGLAKFKNQILAFSTSSFEVFRNVGNPVGSPLKSIPELAGEIGITTGAGGTNAARHYYTTVEDFMFFNGAPTGLYAWNGQRVEKVSTAFIEKILSERTCFGVFKIRIGAIWYVLMALDIASATTQRWLAYCPQWKEWFEWNSTVWCPVGVASGVQFFVGVGANQHRLYTVGTAENAVQDEGTSYQFALQFKLPRKGARRNFMSMCGVTGDTASATLNLGVQFSDDDYVTQSTARNIDLAGVKKSLHGCGSYFDRSVTLSYTGALSPRLESFFARVD